MVQGMCGRMARGIIIDTEPDRTRVASGERQAERVTIAACGTSHDRRSSLGPRTAPRVPVCPTLRPRSD